MPQMEALMSLTKIYIAIAVSAALAASSTGCRQFKELVNEEPKTEAMYGDREAERKARRKRVFGF